METTPVPRSHARSQSPGRMGAAARRDLRPLQRRARLPVETGDERALRRRARPRAAPRRELWA